MDRPLSHNRDVLVDTLVHHWMTNSSGCGGCDELKLGQSYPEHIANVYERALSETQAVKHEFTTATQLVGNFAKCTCGDWSVSTDFDPGSDWFRIRWLFHVVAELQ